MQKFLYIAVLLGLPAVFNASCKKEGLSTYNTNNSIYFENWDQDIFFRDSSIITFAYDKATVTDSIIKIRVNVTGSPSTQDRPFKISVDPSSTAVAGTHFEALPEAFILPAGKVFDSIKIKLLRTPDLKNNTVRLVLQLQPNELFTPDIKIQGLGDDGTTLLSHVQYKILLSDILTEPAGWSYSFGLFSPKKMAIISELGGIDAVFLNAGDAAAPLNSREFVVKIGYLCELLKAYLLAQKNAGTPVYYEDGITEMVTDDY